MRTTEFATYKSYEDLETYHQEIIDYLLNNPNSQKSEIATALGYEYSGNISTFIGTLMKNELIDQRGGYSLTDDEKHRAFQRDRKQELKIRESEKSNFHKANLELVKLESLSVEFNKFVQKGIIQEVNAIPYLNDGEKSYILRRLARSIRVSPEATNNCCDACLNHLYGVKMDDTVCCMKCNNCRWCND